MSAAPLPFQASAIPRVLHVIASVSAKRGGTSTAVWMILETLKRRGIVCDLVTTDDDGPVLRSTVPLDRFVEERGFRVRYFPRQTKFYSASKPLATWLWSNIGNYDLVHIHGLFGFVPVIAAQIARASGVPFVVCPHGMLERWGRQNRRSVLKKLSIRFIEGPMLRDAAAVHFTSVSENRQAEDIGVPMKAAVFPLALVDDGPAADSERSFVRPDSAELLFLSRIDRKKGLDVLIAAFASLRKRYPKLRLVIAGDGPAELTEELRDLADRLGVADGIRWPGFVQGEQKARLFCEATIFVLPSHSENFGYAVAEAMAAGLPVVVSRAVGVSDLVERSGAGLVTDSTVESLVDRLETVIDDAELRRTMGVGGREAVKNELSIDTFAHRMVDLYDSIVTRRSNQPYGSVHNDLKNDFVSSHQPARSSHRSP